MNENANSDLTPVRRLVTDLRAAQLPPPALRRRVRRRAGVALREAAEVLGVSPMTVLRWERGEAQPTREHAIAYRRLLDELEKVVAP